MSTDGTRPGSDWPERPESGLLDRTGEGVDRCTSKLSAGVQNVKLLEKVWGVAAVDLEDRSCRRMLVTL